MAEVKILVEGFTNADSDEGDEEVLSAAARSAKPAGGGAEKTCATITLVRDKDIVMVCDPGVLESQQILVDALKNEGLTIPDVNYVFITHSHIDHYRNIGMFPNAKTLEYFGIWEGGGVEDWKEDFTEDIKIIKTPGHNYDGLTLLVKTKEGVVAICGDVFWKENYPERDPLCVRPEETRGKPAQSFGARRMDRSGAFWKI